jgi:hypothetical protein
MLRVDVSEIATAEVVPLEANEFGVSYVTKDGRRITDRIGTKSEADAIVRQVSMLQDTAKLFPRDTAAS